jgi:hypothetical protein
LATTTRSDSFVNQGIFSTELPENGYFIDSGLIGYAASSRATIAVPGVYTGGGAKELVAAFHLRGKSTKGDGITQVCTCFCDVLHQWVTIASIYCSMQGYG